MQFGNLSYSQGSPVDPGLPIEDIKAVSLELTNRYNTNRDAANKLLTEASSIPYISSSTNDAAIVASSVAKVKGSINKMVENQDFHRSSDTINGMVMDLQSNNGLKAVMTSYKTMQDDFADIDKAKGFSNEQKQILKARQVADYKGVEYDPTENIAKGGYQKYGIEDAPDLDQINKIMAMFKADKSVQNSGWKGLDVNKVDEMTNMKGIKEYIQNVETTTETITEQDVRKAVLGYLQNSPAYKSYYNTLGDIEVYKMQKALGTTDLNNPQATTAILGTIRNYASHVDPTIILNQMGVNLKKFAKLPDANTNPNAPKTQQSVYTAAVDAFAQQMYSQNQQMGGDNTSMLKEMVAYNEADKVANIYANVIGYSSITQKYDLKSNTLWGKKYDENSKAMPFSIAGNNIDIGDFSTLQKSNVENVKQLDVFKTQLTNLQNGHDSVLANLQNALRKAKSNGDAASVANLEMQVSNRRKEISNNIDQLKEKISATDVQIQNFNMIRQNAISRAGINYSISDMDASKVFNSNPFRTSKIYSKKTAKINNFALESINADVSREQFKEKVTELIKTLSSDDYLSPDKIMKSVKSALYDYDKLAQYREDKINSQIANYQANGGKISVPTQLVSMEGNKVYDGAMAGINTALDSGQPWPIIGNSDYTMANDKNFIENVVNKSATKKVTLVRTTENPTGNLMVNVTYFDRNHVPLSTVMMSVPSSVALNAGLTRNLLVETMNNPDYGPNGSMASIGDNTRNILAGTQLATMPYYSSVSASENGTKVAAGTLGQLFRDIDNAEGEITRSVTISNPTGGQSILKIHKNADGVTAQLLGGTSNIPFDIKPFDGSKHIFNSANDIYAVLYNDLIYPYARKKSTK